MEQPLPHPSRAVLLLALSFGLLAAPAIAADSASDQTILLNPFEVRTDKDNGYIANDTVAGGRLSVNLLKSPNDVTVITRDFLDDIGAYNLNEAAAWLTSSTVNLPTDNRDFGGNVSFRGLATGLNTRDYFSYPSSVEEYIIERIEGARGPNSIIYGDAGSGGQINITTKRATFRNFWNLALRTDNWGTRRSTLDVNHRLSDKLAIRFNALAQDRRTWIENYRDRREAADLAATYRPWQNTEVRFEGEFNFAKVSNYGYVFSDTSSLWDRHTVVTSPLTANLPAATGVVRFTTDKLVISPSLPDIVNLKNFARTTGTFLNLVNDPRPFPNFPVLPRRSFRITPAQSTLGTHTSNGAIFIEQKLPHDAVVEVAVATSTVKRDQVRTEANNTYIDINQVLPGGSPNPNFGKYYSESTYSHDTAPQFQNNYRIAGAIPWNTSAFSQTFSAVVQRREDWFDPRTYALARTKDPANPAISPNLTDVSNQVYFWRYWDDAGAPLRLPTSANGYEFTSYATRDTHRDTALDSLQFNTIGYYFRRSLTLVAGTRFDRYEVSSRTGLFGTTGYPAGDRFNKVYTSAHTNSAGLTYFPIHAAGVYANYSEGFLPQQDENPWIGSRGPQFTTHSRGHSAGLRLQAFNDQLVGSIGYYDSHEGNRMAGQSGARNQINQIWTDLNQPSRLIQGPFSIVNDTVDADSKGWEADLTANIANALRVKANIAFPQTTQSNALPDIQEYVRANIAEWRAGAADPTNPNAQRLQTNIATLENLVSGAANGRTLNGTYKYRANILANYVFSRGRLKGFKIGGGANLYGHALIGNPTGQPFSYIYAQEYAVFSANLGYSFKLAHQTVDLQLNVTNLTDFDRPVFTGVTVYQGVAYKNAYTYVQPRTEVLTATIRF